MIAGSSGIALLSGILSTLSPCVLPLIPIVLGAAVSEHRLGVLALAAGLAISFVAIGLFIATVGYAIGLDAGHLRALGGAVLIGIGVVLLMPSLRTQFALTAGPLSGWADSHMRGLSTTGLRGQLALGLLLGVVWIPCAGPTLGAASVLAARASRRRDGCLRGRRGSPPCRTWFAVARGPDALARPSRACRQGWQHVARRSSRRRGSTDL